MSDSSYKETIKTIFASVVLLAATLTFAASIVYVVWLIVSNYTIPALLVTLWAAGMFAQDYLSGLREKKTIEEKEKQQEHELIEF